MPRGLVTQSLEPDGVLQLHQLETADIPVWRSEQLDEEAAYADERFGCYLPTAVALPFDRAHRELGEGRDWLTASWSADVQNLTVTVSPSVGDPRRSSTRTKRRATTCACPRTAWPPTRTPGTSRSSTGRS